MKSWQKVFLAVAFLAVAFLAAVVAADDAHEGDAACDLDQPGLTENDKNRRIKTKATECFKAHVDLDKLEALKDLPPLEAYQEIIGGLCSHSHEVTTCLAGVRTGVANCKSKNLTETFLLYSETAEHVFTAGCAHHDGENLAILFRSFVLLYQKPEDFKPLRRCLLKTYPSISMHIEQDLDLASASYILYKESERAKRCLEHIHDEAYKSAAQWLNDVVHTGMKCKLPDEDRYVLCSEVDPDKLTTLTLCKTSPFSEPGLYERLEARADHCYLDRFFNFEESYPQNVTDLDFLKDMYKHYCKMHRQLPECLVLVSSMGEHCLPANEEKQFELEIQSIERYIDRLCVADGDFAAVVMLHVYKNAPVHGNAFKDCEGMSGNATYDDLGSNKGRRYYDYFQGYKKCVVGKLHEYSDIAAGLETAFNDVLRDMKCVNPEDDAVVNCESIYQEH